MRDRAVSSPQHDVLSISHLQFGGRTVTALFSSVRRLRWGIFWAVCFLAAICWIPYRVAAPASVSSSYLFGYNNRVALAIVAVAVVALGWFAPPLVFTAARGVKPLQRSTLFKAMAITVAVGSLFAFLAHRLDGFEESVYLIDRVKLVLEGHRPYRDFEYAYGAAFLYLPAMLVRVLGLTAANAYLTVWALSTLLGIALLYRTLLLLDAPAMDRRRVFLLLWLATLLLVTCTGVNYSLLRFILPGHFAVWIERRLRAVPTRGGEARAILLCVPLFALLLLVSPEMGVSFALGITAFLGWTLRTRLSSLAPSLGLTVAGLAIVAFLALRLGVFGTMLAFRDGGMNLPLMPAPHLLVFFCCLGLVVCFVAGETRAGRSSGMLALVAVTLGSLAAALGRCDAIHVLFDPIGILIVGCLLATRLPSWRSLHVAILMVFVALPNFYLQTTLSVARAALPAWFAVEHRGYAGRIDRWLLDRMTAALGPVTAQERFENLRARGQAQQQIDLPFVFQLPESTIFASPFGVTLTHFGVYQASSIDEGFYYGTLNLTTPEGVQRKIDELAAHPERPLLLPPGAENSCVATAAQVREEVAAIRGLFAYPYSARAVHLDGPLTPLCSYIRQNYRQAQAATAEHFGYALWVRSPPDPDTSGR